MFPSVYYNYDRDKQEFVASNGREEGSITGAHIRVSTLPPNTPGDTKRITVDIDFAGEGVIVAAIRKLAEIVRLPLPTPASKSEAADEDITKFKPKRQRKKKGQ